MQGGKNEGWLSVVMLPSIAIFRLNLNSKKKKNINNLA